MTDLEPTARDVLGQPLPSYYREDAITGREILEPVSGRWVNLDGDTTDIAALVYRLRELKTLIDEAIRTAGAELLERQDKAAAWTTRCGPLVVEGSSPARKRVVKNPEALWNRLEQLVREGKLTVEARDAAVRREERVTYTPVVRGVNAVEKAGEAAADAVAECSEWIQPVRSTPSVKLA